MKKNFIRIISFILALITLTLGFSACADSGAGSDTTAAEVNATTSAPDGDTASGENEPLKAVCLPTCQAKPSRWRSVLLHYNTR